MTSRTSLSWTEAHFVTSGWQNSDNDHFSSRASEYLAEQMRQGIYKGDRSLSLAIFLLTVAWMQASSQQPAPAAQPAATDSCHPDASGQEQPLPFSHKRHAGELALSCGFVCLSRSGRSFKIPHNRTYVCSAIRQSPPINLQSNTSPELRSRKRRFLDTHASTRHRRPFVNFQPQNTS